MRGLPSILSQNFCARSLISSLNNIGARMLDSILHKNYDIEITVQSLKSLIFEV